MTGNVVQLGITAGSPALRPLRERIIKITGERGVTVYWNGLKISFGADHDKVLFSSFSAGSVKLVGFPGRLELWQIGKSGAIKVIGKTTYDADRRFYVGGQPARDEKGEVIGKPPGAYRGVKAEVLFPVLSRVKRVNRYVKGTGWAFFMYGGKPYVNLAKLIPELGRIEKKMSQGCQFSYRTLPFYLHLKPGDRYYDDLQMKRLVFRALGPRIEIFADREEGKEFIASLARGDDGTNPLEIAGSPRIKAGWKKEIGLSRVFPAVDEARLTSLLKSCQYADIDKLFSDGAALNRLKKFAVYGRGYLASPETDEAIASKLLYALACGMKRLDNTLALSADLKKAFSREILETMLLAAGNTQLSRIRELLKHYCQDAYATFKADTTCQMAA
jgi:hypothetical protein